MANSINFVWATGDLISESRLLAMVADTIGPYGDERVWPDNIAAKFGTGEDVSITFNGTHLQAALAAPASFLWGDTSNANMTQGITINQGAADDDILALKSSDVAHGVTDQVETDTYFHARKASATAGGVVLGAYAETGVAVALALKGVATDDDTAKTTSARAPVEAQAYKVSGTNQGAQGADANSFVVLSNGAAKFLVDEDGDFLYDGADGGAFDAYDDVALLRAFSHATAPASVVRDEWDSFVRYNEADLVELGILGAPVSKGGLVNGAQLQRVLVGAVWQQAKRIMALESRLALAEGR